MSPQRWGRRALLAVVVTVAVWVVARRVETSVDVLRLSLLVALVVTAWGLVVDSLGSPSPLWRSDAARAAVPTGLDLPTQRYLSVLESHLDARFPDHALRDRLARLADGALHVRHGESRGTPRGRELLGPELTAVLTEEPRRLTRAEIERCVQRIESL